MKKIPLAGPGYPYILSALGLTVVFYFIFTPLFYLFLLLTLFIAYFFRDPPRHVPQEKGLILAPADGRVLKVEEVQQAESLEGRAWRISIFLSVFDVHVNRSPCAGTVLFCRHLPGSFLAAYKDEAPAVNERNLIGLQTEAGRMLIVQIAGKVARRIICWVNTGDEIKPGDYLGMIKFGSCTELFLPVDVEIKVKVGDRVRAGETILGMF